MRVRNIPSEKQFCSKLTINTPKQPWWRAGFYIKLDKNVENTCKGLHVISKLLAFTGTLLNMNLLTGMLKGFR